MLGVDPIKNLVVPRFLALMIVTGLFNIYALIFGIFGGVLATLTFDAPWAPSSPPCSTTPRPPTWGSVVKTTLFGAIIAIVSGHKGMTASGGAEGVGRAVNQGVVIEFLGIFAFNYVFTQTLLATHPEISGHQVMGRTWLSVPRDWISSFGEIAKFCGRIVANVFNGRVFHFFGEALRQAGILILGSAIVIWGLAFIPRAAVRHRGRLLQPLGGRAGICGCFQRLV